MEETNKSEDLTGYGGYEPYKGGNPDSDEAYFGKDITGPENEDVVIKERVSDEDMTFVWHRRKSNENITGDGDGKGFSFYLARKVFGDDYNYPIEEGEDKEKLIGVIPNDRSKNVVAVINIEVEKNTYRIISANFLEETHRLAEKYWQRRKKIQRREAIKDEPLSAEEEMERKRVTESLRKWRERRRIIEAKAEMKRLAEKLNS